MTDMETPNSTPPVEPTIDDKVRFLSDPAHYPHRPGSVEVLETHMSWVFLAGGLVYKLKKPVHQPFLDLRSLAQRVANVETEIRLNRRLAPEVYLGERALRATGDGALTLTGTGRVVDQLVEMRRLPEDRTLQALIAEGRAGPADLDRLGAALVEFYAALPGEDAGADAVIAHFEREHVKTAEVLCDPQFGLDPDRRAAAVEGFEAVFDQARPVLRRRVDEGRFVEGHGDLRLEHVFMTDPLAIIDCLEFSRELRVIDPFEEIICLSLDAAHLGADWVFPVLYDHLATGLNDRPDPVILQFYWRYRALLRARFALLHLAEKVIRTPEKWLPLARHYLTLSDQADIRTRPPEDR